MDRFLGAALRAEASEMEASYNRCGRLGAISLASANVRIAALATNGVPHDCSAAIFMPLMCRDKQGQLPSKVGAERAR